MCEGSQLASEHVHKEEGHERDRTDVSEDMLAQKGWKMFSHLVHIECYQNCCHCCDWQWQQEQG